MTKIHQTVLPIRLEKSDEKVSSLSGLLVLEEMSRAKGLWGRVDWSLRFLPSYRTEDPPICSAKNLSPLHDSLKGYTISTSTKSKANESAVPSSCR